MGLINPNKNYKDLITFGCSYTTGYVLGEQGSWGYHLSKRLGCNHVNRGGGQTNSNIFLGILNYCETHDMTDCCVGIQWSELSRREFWDSKLTSYNSFGLGALKSFGDGDTNEDLIFIDKNIEFFQKIWFEIPENMIRTISAMLSAKSYLLSKNIDFIMSEGINSIMDYKIKKSDGDKYNMYIGLLNEGIKQSILNDITFFTELGDLHRTQTKHPDYNTDANETHPSMGVVKWWTDSIYDYLVKNN